MSWYRWRWWCFAWAVGQMHVPQSEVRDDAGRWVSIASSRLYWLRDPT